MSWHVWYLFAVTEAVLCVVPGPAVLFVLSQGLSHGTRRATWSILGIVAANTAYFVLSATGIGAMLLASYDLFLAIKWIGAVYLVWLGLNAIFSRSGLVLQLSDEGAPPPSRRLFANGFVLQMSNPKALIFFAALVPQFVDPHAPVWSQMALLAITSAAIEFAVQLFYAAVAGLATPLVTRPPFAALSERIAGALLVAAGTGLAVIRR